MATLQALRPGPREGKGLGGGQARVGGRAPCASSPAVLLGHTQSWTPHTRTVPASLPITGRLRETHLKHLAVLPCRRDASVPSALPTWGCPCGLPVSSRWPSPWVLPTVQQHWTPALGTLSRSAHPLPCRTLLACEQMGGRAPAALSLCPQSRKCVARGNLLGERLERFCLFPMLAVLYWTCLLITFILLPYTYVCVQSPVT